MDTVKSPDELAKATIELMGFTDDDAQNIANAISKEVDETIKSGNVTPALKPLTVKVKKLKGYPKPDAPLYATGKMASSLELGDHSNTKIEIVSYDRVDLRWHMYGTNRLPAREVLPDDKLNEIVRSALD